MSVTEHDPRIAVAATGLLRTFNHAGVLDAADVHVAARLCELLGEDDERVLLAAALAVRAPRHGHVLVDLRSVAQTVQVDADEPVDIASLPWPDREPWLQAVRTSPAVATADATPDLPFQLVGAWLYLARHAAQERQVADALRALATPAPAVDPAALHEGIARLFADGTDSRQAQAAASAVLQRFAVIGGGPGTGKTTTVAKVVALLHEQAERRGTAPPLVALAAPTGKAAARLQESLAREAPLLDAAPAVREQVGALEATTLHRLLGARPGSSSWRHGPGNPLPHDVVVVDEMSMVSLPLMDRLLGALRAGARLVMVGDPAQLVSIEAGAVLADVIGPALVRPLLQPAARRALEAAVGAPADAELPPPGVAVGDGIVVLERTYRYNGAIADAAAAIRDADGDRLVEVLRAGCGNVTWLDLDAATATADELEPVRNVAVDAGRAMVLAARAGRRNDALAALASARLLCAHRRGAYGVGAWTEQIERWLAETIAGFSARERWYVGRPLLVTANDRALRINNGDTGVIVTDGDHRVAVVDRAPSPIDLAPSRLGAVETAHAMTIHKAQGSQFGTAVVVLPDPRSRLLSRELLYTAMTRAEHHLLVVGTEASLRAAVERPIARPSGLRWRLWGDATP